MNLRFKFTGNRRQSKQKQKADFYNLFTDVVLMLQNSRYSNEIRKSKTETDKVTEVIVNLVERKTAEK